LIFRNYGLARARRENSKEGGGSPEEEKVGEKDEAPSSASALWYILGRARKEMIVLIENKLRFFLFFFLYLIHRIT